MSGTVKLGDLEDAMDYVSSGELLDCEAYLCLATGEILYSDDEDADWAEPLPEDIDDLKKYIPIPRKNDLDLGRTLVMRFVTQVLPEDQGGVEVFFGRKGAYGRFKGLLEDRGVLDRWYEFEANSRKEALREWCAENGITCSD